MLWSPILLYCLLIFGLSSLSRVAGLPFAWSDKAAHLLLYAGLGALVTRALTGGVGRPVSLRTVLVVVSFVAVYGLSDEIHQAFVPNRSCELLDWIADVAGAALGSGVLWLWGIIARFRDVV